EAVTLTAFVGACELQLPVRPPRSRDEALRPFRPANAFAARGEMVLQTALTHDGKPPTKMLEWDVGAEGLKIRSTPFDAVGTIRAAEVLSIQDSDPTSASLEYRREVEDAPRNIKIGSSLRLQVTKETFLLAGTIVASESAKEIFRREWNE